MIGMFFFFSSRRRHTRLQGDWSSDVCSSDLGGGAAEQAATVSAQHVAGANRVSDSVLAPRVEHRVEDRALRRRREELREAPAGGTQRALGIIRRAAQR